MSTLALERQQGESIVIGDGADQVMVTVARIKGDKVRLAITAPSHTPVDRLEIRNAKDADARKALES